MSWPDSIGLLGVIIILIAYGALQLNYLGPKSQAYSLLNILGSLLIIVSLFYKWNISAFIMEISWLFISICGLLKARSS